MQSFEWLNLGQTTLSSQHLPLQSNPIISHSSGIKTKKRGIFSFHENDSELMNLLTNFINP